MQRRHLALNAAPGGDAARGVLGRREHAADARAHAGDPQPVPDASRPSASSCGRDAEPDARTQPVADGRTDRRQRRADAGADPDADARADAGARPPHPRHRGIGRAVGQRPGDRSDVARGPDRDAARRSGRSRWPRSRRPRGGRRGRGPRLGCQRRHPGRPDRVARLHRRPDPGDLRLPLPVPGRRVGSRLLRRRPGLPRRDRRRHGRSRSGSRRTSWARRPSSTRARSRASTGSTTTT